LLFAKSQHIIQRTDEENEPAVVSWPAMRKVINLGQGQKIDAVIQVRAYIIHDRFV
jgi:hypothetical protein